MFKVPKALSSRARLSRLRESLVVWTEVEFVALYKHQPLFGDIDRQLAEAGLRFFCFTGFGQRQLASWPDGAQPRAGQRMQQLWADAIYVPTPERMAQMDGGSLARLAVLCHEVLAAPDLCHETLCLLRAASRPRRRRRRGPLRACGRLAASSAAA